MARCTSGRGSGRPRCPTSTSAMWACRSAVSNRTSGSNPACRQACSAKCRDAAPCGSTTQGRSAVSARAGAGASSRLAAPPAGSRRVVRPDPVELGMPWRGMARVLLGDDQVEVAGEGLQQRRLGLALGHRDPEPRDAGRPARAACPACSASAADWKTAIRTVPVASSLRRGEVGLGQLEPLQDRRGVLDQDLRLRGELHPPAGLAQQRDPGLLLEQAELLRRPTDGL